MTPDRSVAPHSYGVLAHRHLGQDRRTLSERKTNRAPPSTCQDAFTQNRGKPIFLGWLFVTVVTLKGGETLGTAYWII